MKNKQGIMLIHRRGFIKWSFFKVILPIILLLVGCKFPNDPDQTLLKINTSHIIKIGICTCQENMTNQTERLLLTSIANTLKAQINWISNTQEALYRSLEAKEIDIVACEIEEDSPWNERVALTISYGENPVTHKKNAFALPSGENAWLKYIDEYIYHSRKTL